MKYYLNEYSITKSIEHIFYDKYLMDDRTLLATITYYKLYEFYMIYIHYKEFNHMTDGLIQYKTFNLAETYMFEFLHKNDYIPIPKQLEVLL
jgi:hypothetical protein